MIIKLPLAVYLPRKTKEDKKIYINLNEYRNWHYIVSNQAKDIYKKNLESQLTDVKFDGKITLIFTLFRGDKRRVDRSNILSIHEKFFCDALTFYGCIKDDNDNFIEETRYRSGQVDRENPRVEVEILKIK
jgi:Holliday junction resolvase RusA-like endonuclease